MKFIPYRELGTRPNIIVDGAGQAGTRLTLSHWPQSGTPLALLRDTSAEIVFAYLEQPQFHVEAVAASNNHFDEDGLLGLFALLHPDTARGHRGLLEDTANTGDFGVVRTPAATRLCFIIAAHADANRSPLPAELFELPYPDMTAMLYTRLLELMPEFLREPGRFRTCWEDDEERLRGSQAQLASGAIRIEEEPELDLAVVRLPVAELPPDGEGLDMDDICHPYAVYSANRRNRVLLVCGRHIEFRYRYESWVQMQTFRPPARVSLDPLVDRLNDMETSGAVWTSDGVDQITPRLALDGGVPSSIPAGEFETLLREQLRRGAPAWDPYARPG